MQILSDPDACVEAVIERVGKRIRLGTPLGLGKPNVLLNAFYRRAKADPDLDLHILTALTLERPRGHSELEERFLGPFAERVWGDYPDPDYERDRAAGELPPNVRVMEFYLYAGKYLKNDAGQRDYISTNYTYVARDLFDRGVNVLCQEVRPGEVGGCEAISLSCNPDVSLDLVHALRTAGREAVVIGVVNEELPFMYGDAVVPPGTFDLLLQSPELSHRLFGTPKTSVSDAEYMIGLYASTLIRDGGELQIGIGSLGDALVYALRLRHEHNDIYLEALEQLGITERYADEIERLGGTAPFQHGLFAATEMLVDGFMHLIDAGIVKRRVYDDLPLTRLLNRGEITESVTPATLDGLLRERAIAPLLDAEDVAYLVHWGVFRPGIRWEGGKLVLPDGAQLSPSLAAADARAAIEQRCLGQRLAHGCIVHAGFFLGPESFYQWLRDMPDEQRQQINMRSVTRINQLYGHEELDRLHRRDARFVNTGMMVTLSGAVVSDGLDSGAVVSGVGGQYNFVAMAHALPDGHSILQIRATHGSGEKLSSGVRFNYGHTTIPRHQRDLIITEYGIADLRGKTDEEVALSLVGVADHRFQGELLEQARRVGKVARDAELPLWKRGNRPEGYARPLAQLKARGFFPAFPFGTDLTEVEAVLGKALMRLKDKIDSAKGTIEAMADAVVDGALEDDVRPYLERMGLWQPDGLKETLYARLIAAEVRAELEARESAGA